MALKTNYKDDILAPAMGGKRRFNLVENSDGTVSLVDATTYTQQGDMFGASDINSTNTDVNKNSTDLATAKTDITQIKDNLTQVASKFNYPAESEVETDCNRAFSGIIPIDPSTLNKPINDMYGLLLTYRWESVSPWILQNAMIVGESRFFARTWVNGAWSDWNELASKNDGVKVIETPLNFNEVSSNEGFFEATYTFDRPVLVIGVTAIASLNLIASISNINGYVVYKIIAKNNGTHTVAISYIDYYAH